MDTVTVTVEIPVMNRGKDIHGNPITDEALAQSASYVLNIYLQSYCQYKGAPKLGPIKANGILSEMTD